MSCEEQKEQTMKLPPEPSAVEAEKESRKDNVLKPVCNGPTDKGYRQIDILDNCPQFSSADLHVAKPPARHASKPARKRKDSTDESSEEYESCETDSSISHVTTPNSSDRDEDDEYAKDEESNVPSLEDSVSPHHTAGPSESRHSTVTTPSLEDFPMAPSHPDTAPVKESYKMELDEQSENTSEHLSEAKNEDLIEKPEAKSTDTKTDDKLERDTSSEHPADQSDSTTTDQSETKNEEITENGEKSKAVSSAETDKNAETAKNDNENKSPVTEGKSSGAEPVKPKTFDAKSFKVDAPGTRVVTEQDIKDGHSNLRPTAKFLYKIGLSLLRESVYQGLASHVDVSLREGSKKYSQKQLLSLTESLKSLREENGALRFPCTHQCKFELDGRRCGFRTESVLALETHMSESHHDRYDRNHCARCGYWCARSSQPKVFKSHMLAEHGCAAIMLKPKSFYNCKLCPYETNNRQKFDTHTQTCIKVFKPSSNLFPDVQAHTPYGESLFHIQPSDHKLRQMVMAPLPPAKTLPKGVIIITPDGKSKPSGSAHPAPTAVNAANKMLPAPPRVVSNFPPKQVTLAPRGNTDGYSMCEICDGMIQGPQALKVHMQWCHDINIGQFKERLVRCNISPYCLATFWTVQGMAKHSKLCAFRGHYSSITANAVTNPKSGYVICFICNQYIKAPLLEHVLKLHLSDVKRMVEQKICVGKKCMHMASKSPTADQLQAHFLQEHNVSLTGLHALAFSNISNIKFQPFCSVCKIKFAHATLFAQHCARQHVHKCQYCGAQTSTAISLEDHMVKAHPRCCLVCGATIARNCYMEHIQPHLKRCVPKLQRIEAEEYEKYSKKPKLEDDAWESEPNHESGDEEFSPEPSDIDVM